MGLIVAGLETRGVVTVLGIFVLLFALPLLYLRYRLLDWIDRQKKAAERSGNSNKPD